VSKGRGLSRLHGNPNPPGEVMTDLVFIGLILFFLALSLGLVKLCERLQR
jgi:hypothetical protein